MLSKEMKDILSAAGDRGWVLEPEAKHLLNLAGLEVPQFSMATQFEGALQTARTIGYPVVAKVVSAKVLHKSDLGGVVVGIDSDDKLGDTFRHLSRIDGFEGMLVEQTVSGIELIVGAKRDFQFGPVILMGIGGTGVEIYRDTTMRMAPLKPADVDSMVKSLVARPLLEGYRGSESVNLDELTRTMIAFSELVMQLEDQIESIDLNPVMCSSSRCVVADARIILK